MTNFYNYLRFERQLSEITIKNYLFFLEYFRKFLQRDILTFKDLNHVKEMDITSFLMYLQERGNNKASVSLYIVTLRSYYKWASYFYRKENLSRVSFFLNNIVRIKRESKIPIIPTREEIIQLRMILTQFLQLNSWNKNSRPYKDTLKAYAMIELFITAGLRSKELRGLQRKDMDLEKKIIFIRQGKGDYQRISLFGESATEILREYFTIYNFAPEELIFPMAQQNVINRTIKLWATKARINPQIHAHSFRHYFITESRRQGADIQIVADQVGHRDLNTTKHYTHFDIDHIRFGYQKIKI